jgi:hypothetical protein
MHCEVGDRHYRDSRGSPARHEEWALTEKDAAYRAGMSDVEAMLMTPYELVDLVELVSDRPGVSG